MQFLLKEDSRQQTEEVSGESDDGRVKKRAWKPRKKLKLTKESSEDENDANYNDDYASNEGSEELPKHNVCNKEFIDDFAFASVDTQSKTDQQEDPDKMFLLSLLPHLKSIPEGMRLNVKLELMQVLRNANYHTAVDHKII